MYVKITNETVDTYPYNVGQLRRDNPNTSFPKSISNAILEGYGIHSVTIATEPTITKRTQINSQNNSPTIVDSNWTLGWTTTNKTTDQITTYDNEVASNNRTTRNTLIAETDFYALSDVTMTDAMTAYRQALRDLSDHSNWPNLESGDWPTKP